MTTTDKSTHLFPTSRKPYPTTDDGWCERFMELDKEFGTKFPSPLSHAWRCPIHGVDRAAWRTTK